ncbi:hypothetical protein F2Q69_00013118 [Brassica cretica]|uniref:Uncharacterized protein n=1 Tax=Brassica cretica TaxID=69181 RepID=A0A8S9R727_BRACR|nr:hypothetical protein F2Q69_00013118 [Brassica cretica]
MVSIDTNHRASTDIHQSKSIDRSTRASIDNTYGINRVLQCREDSNSRGVQANINRQPSPPIDRRAPITFRVQMPKIDVTRLNALRPKPKPSEQPLEPVRTPSVDGDDSMEEDRVATGRTLRRRKEKVAKHLKSGANEKEKENFQKRKAQRISRGINNPGIIAACHCGDEYETEYSESIEARTATSINSSNQKSTDIPHDESVDSNPDEWENDYYNPTIDAYTRQHTHTDEYDEDYEEERVIEYGAILDEEDKILYHSSCKRTAPSTDRTRLPSIDAQPQQRCRKGASTDTAYYKSIDTDFNRVREGDYLIGSWADETHHESFAVETVTYTPGADKLQDSFTYEELLNMQKRGDTNQIQAEDAWERTRSIDTRHQQSIDKLPQQSIDINNTTSIDNHSIPKPLYPNGYAKAIDSRTLHVSQEDIADILQTANGVDNMFMHQRSNHEQKTTKEFYNAVDVPTVTRQSEFSRRALDPYGNRKFYWEEKDEYGVYRDDREFARDLDGHTIPVDNKDIRRLLERASKNEPAYICLPEHASQFTQTKLVPKIYSNDEINEMFYGVCDEHDRNKEAFQMKLDGVYYPLNDSISWLTTCIEEMKQDIARI